MAEFQLKERAFQFSVSLLKFFGSLQFNQEFKFLKIQLYRSATSIGANIIEGSGGSSKKQLAQYYSIALRSANETTYWLKVISEVFLEIDRNIVSSHIAECESISRILGKSITSLRSPS